MEYSFKSSFINYKSYDFYSRKPTFSQKPIFFRVEIVDFILCPSCRRRNRVMRLSRNDRCRKKTAGRSNKQNYKKSRLQMLDLILDLSEPLPALHISINIT
jgi:hypothetical protein